MVRAGDRLSTGELTRRLERSGYARTAAPPARPGQYSASSSQVDLHLRAFPRRRPRPRGATGQPALLREARAFDPRRAGARGRSGHARAGEDLDLLRLATGRAPPDRARADPGVADRRGARRRGRPLLRPSTVWTLRGIVRAALDQRAARARSCRAASTITQQTVKNLYPQLSSAPGGARSRELAMALGDARRPLPQGPDPRGLSQRGLSGPARSGIAICGAQAASRFYFGRDLEHDLTLAESMRCLAGMIRSPGAATTRFAHPGAGAGSAATRCSTAMARNDPGDASERSKRSRRPSSEPTQCWPAAAAASAGRPTRWTSFAPGSPSASPGRHSRPPTG